MSWNPSPGVAAARDFGTKCGKDIVIILHISDDKIGYASYGKTKELCGVAKELADTVYQAIYDAIDQEKVTLS